jgi:hypothetical protein
MVPAPRLTGATGYEKTQSGYILCVFFLRHIFCALELLRDSFIAHKKRQEPINGKRQECG